MALIKLSARHGVAAYGVVADVKSLRSVQIARLKQLIFCILFLLVMVTARAVPSEARKEAFGDLLARTCQVVEDQRAEPRQWLHSSEGTNGGGPFLVRKRLSAADGESHTEIRDYPRTFNCTEPSGPCLECAY